MSGFVSPGGRNSDDEPLCSQKSPLAFTDWRHLWHRSNVRLSNNIHSSSKVSPVIRLGNTVAGG